MSSRNHRIGLLGGSFNPAHKGHLYISNQALKRLNLNYIWWVVAPQNPLKRLSDMISFDDRLQIARKLASRNRRIIINEFEQVFGTKYTADTLQQIVSKYPKFDFVWLMGADNLLQISRWERWTSIFDTMPVAVFGRPSYSVRALRSKAARVLANHYIAGQNAKNLTNRKPPVWTFFVIPENPESGTKIRLNSDSADNPRQQTF